ncbi:hypothetical protein POTOM_051379 [Populus tomentosa]|uniref:Uncharacterized protein n=1 Tax=Populus tomentosa TaxID=118781 RepID=A0A8X8C165_POPTO|nr:hypothetical protein POTOM_051379 [Populus tomentosa]
MRIYRVRVLGGFERNGARDVSRGNHFQTRFQVPSLSTTIKSLDSMAGLQYNFFPTDFFYPPRPQSVKVDASTTAQKSIALPLEFQKREAMITDDLNQKQYHPTSLVLRHNKHGNKSNTPMNRSSTA